MLCHTELFHHAVRHKWKLFFRNSQCMFRTMRLHVASHTETRNAAELVERCLRLIEDDESFHDDEKSRRNKTGSDCSVRNERLQVDPVPQLKLDAT